MTDFASQLKAVSRKLAAKNEDRRAAYIEEYRAMILSGDGNVERLLDLATALGMNEADVQMDLAHLAKSFQLEAATQSTEPEQRLEKAKAVEADVKRRFGALMAELCQHSNMLQVWQAATILVKFTDHPKRESLEFDADQMGKEVGIAYTDATSAIAVRDRAVRGLDRLKSANKRLWPDYESQSYGVAVDNLKPATVEDIQYRPPVRIDF